MAARKISSYLWLSLLLVVNEERRWLATELADSSKRRDIFPRPSGTRSKLRFQAARGRVERTNARSRVSLNAALLISLENFGPFRSAALFSSRLATKGLLGALRVSRSGPLAAHRRRPASPGNGLPLTTLRIVLLTLAPAPRDSRRIRTVFYPLAATGNESGGKLSTPADVGGSGDEVSRVVRRAETEGRLKFRIPISRIDGNDARSSASPSFRATDFRIDTPFGGQT